MEFWTKQVVLEGLGSSATLLDSFCTLLKWRLETFIQKRVLLVFILGLQVSVTLLAVAAANEAGQQIVVTVLGSRIPHLYWVVYPGSLKVIGILIWQSTLVA